MCGLENASRLFRSFIGCYSSLRGASLRTIIATHFKLANINLLATRFARSPQEIFISVVFSHDVHVDTNNGAALPYLLLSTGNIDRKAYFNSTSGSYSIGSSVTFKYTVQNGDQSPDLDYKSVDSLVLPSGSHIRRHSTTPTTPAITTLVDPGATGSLADSAGLVIDTTTPRVLSVAATPSPTNPTTTLNGFTPLAAGDELFIDVTYNTPVTVSGTPKIYVNTAASNPSILEYVIAVPEDVTYSHDATMARSSEAVFVVVDFEFTSTLAINEYVQVKLPSFGQRKPSDVASLSINATHPQSSKGLPMTASWDVASTTVTLTATKAITPTMAPSTDPVTYPGGIAVRLRIDASNFLTAPSTGVRKGASGEAGIFLTTNAASGPVTSTSTYNLPSTVLTGIGISEARITQFQPVIAGYATEARINFAVAEALTREDKILLTLPDFYRNTR